MIGIGRRCERTEAETAEYRWPAGTLVTWAIVDGTVPPGVAGYVLACARRATEAWERACGIKSTYVVDPAQAHVLIHFGSIDGPGGVLGETEEPVATTPATRLSMDLDPAEPWTPEYLEDVMRHEWGHALGVGHTTVPDNTMLAFYDGTVHQLGTWDVGQGVERYGPVVPESTTRNQRFQVEIKTPGTYIIDVASPGVLSLVVTPANT